MTRFKGTPLFGQDSSPQNTSFILGLIGTGIFWFLLLICALLIKPVQKKPKYKEVQIVLSSTPKKEKSAENPAPAAASSSVSESTPQTVAEKPAEPVQKPAETPVQKPAESPVQEKVQEAVKKVETQPKKVTETNKTTPTATKKTAETPAKKPAESVKQPVKEPEPVVYGKTMEERIAEQFAAKPKAKNDEDVWAEMEDEEDISPSAVSTSAQSEKIVKNVPAFEGSAASTTKADSSSTSSAALSSKSENKTTSQATSSALSNIKNQTFDGNAVNGVESSTNVKATTSGSGKVQLLMSNGSNRALLEPASPVINLSEAAAMTIDGSRTVKIKFRVVESGNVPVTEITITPAAILTELVRSEILDQISRWRFEAADYSAYAEFEYKIVKW